MLTIHFYAEVYGKWLGRFNDRFMVWIIISDKSIQTV
jgi:hypothetical protein